jgi:hypothetical protein
MTGTQMKEARAAGSAASSLLPILELLDKAKLSGSLEFSGSCETFSSPEFPRFPELNTNSTVGSSPLQTLREFFANDPAMHVTQDPDGTVRMTESGVPQDILNVKISHISFDGNGVGFYNPYAAMNFITWTPEVRLFMTSHHIGWPYSGNVANGIFGTVPTSLPHLSGHMDNITLSEAMDHVLKTFPGVWIYENCPRSDSRGRVVYFQFYQLQRTGSRAIVQ